MRDSSSSSTVINDTYNTIQKRMTNEMRVSLSLYLAKTTHLHSKMSEDGIINYQLHNPESFKESKIRYFQLDLFFLKIIFTEEMTLRALTDTDVCTYICIHTDKKPKQKPVHQRSYSPNTKGNSCTKGYSLVCKLQSQF